MSMNIQIFKYELMKLINDTVLHMFKKQVRHTAEAHQSVMPFTAKYTQVFFLF